jgi:hypothetical protein
MPGASGNPRSIYHNARSWLSRDIRRRWWWWWWCLGCCSVADRSMPYLIHTHETPVLSHDAVVVCQCKQHASGKAVTLDRCNCSASKHQNTRHQLHEIAQERGSEVGVARQPSDIQAVGEDLTMRTGNQHCWCFIPVSDPQTHTHTHTHIHTLVGQRLQQHAINKQVCCCWVCEPHCSISSNAR